MAVIWVVLSSDIREAKRLAASEGVEVMLLARFSPSRPQSLRLLGEQLSSSSSFAHTRELLDACQLVVAPRTSSPPSSPSHHNHPPSWKFQSPVPHCAFPIIIYTDCSDAEGGGNELEPFSIRAVVGFMDYKARLLTFLSAYTSTLGGGYFLCKHVSVAWRLALRQERIALALEDYTSAGQCRVHLTYILMQMGRLKEARRRLRREHAYAAKVLFSDHLVAIVRAASMYLDKLSLEEDELRKPAPNHHHQLSATAGEGDGVDGSLVVDNYRRQRFVVPGQSSSPPPRPMPRLPPIPRLT